jgi:hypothetical protein
MHRNLKCAAEIDYYENDDDVLRRGGVPVDRDLPG